MLASLCVFLITTTHNHREINMAGYQDRSGFQLSWLQVMDDASHAEINTACPLPRVAVHCNFFRECAFMSVPLCTASWAGESVESFPCIHSYTRTFPWRHKKQRSPMKQAGSLRSRKAASTMMITTSPYSSFNAPDAACGSSWIHSSRQWPTQKCTSCRLRLPWLIGRLEASKTCVEVELSQAKA